MPDEIPPPTPPGLPDRGDVFNRKCPTRQVLEHVTGRWGGLALGALRDGRVMRFAELRRALVGVSEKMLAQTLRALERDGLVRRRSLPVVPPHVEYSLTPAGAECAARLWALADWVEENLHPLVRAQHAYDAEQARG